MRVRFIAAFDYVPTRFRGRWLKAYPAGFVGTVKRECGEAAIAAGKAVLVEPPPVEPTPIALTPTPEPAPDAE